MVCATQNAQNTSEAGPAVSAGWMKACSVSAAVQKYKVARAQRHRVSIPTRDQPVEITDLQRQPGARIKAVPVPPDIVDNPVADGERGKGATQV